MRIVTVTARDRAPFADRVRALEEGATYPLGDDAFHLDHGDDYFAFFDRLGEVAHELVLDGDRVAAVSARVLRDRGAAGACWYLCDLKVHPDYRGRHLPFRIAAHAFAGAYARCRRGYGVSMNPGDGSENRVVRLLQKMKILPLALATKLVFFSLDDSAMTRAAPVVEAHRGPLSYLSLRGVKDVVLESTGAPMPLLHVQFGPTAARGLAAPQADAVHMFCAPVADPMVAELVTAGHAIDATASVVQHGMGGDDFRWVLTSEI